MDPLAVPKAAPDLNVALQQAQGTGPSPVAQAADRRVAEFAATMRNEILPDKLLVRLDENAGRFVQTLTDANTQETLRRYPNEGQLAFSRAISAYMQALGVK